MMVWLLENGIIFPNHLNVWKPYENLHFPSPLYFLPWINAWGNHFKMLGEKKNKNVGAVEACLLAMVAFVCFKISSDCGRPYKTLVNSFFLLSGRFLQILGGSELLLVLSSVSLNEQLRAVQRHYFFWER